MKTIITTILIGTLATQPVLTGEYSSPSRAHSPQPKTEQHWLLAAFVLSAALVAGAVVLYIHSQHEVKGAKGIILERSQDNGHWIPVATNIVTVTTDPQEFYSTYPRDGAWLYRLRVIPTNDLPVWIPVITNYYTR
jgi:hypothetical protein